MQNYHMLMLLRRWINCRLLLITVHCLLVRRWSVLIKFSLCWARCAQCLIRRFVIMHWTRVGSKCRMTTWMSSSSVNCLKGDRIRSLTARSRVYVVWSFRKLFMFVLSLNDFILYWYRNYLILTGIADSVNFATIAAAANATHTKDEDKKYQTYSSDPVKRPRTVRICSTNIYHFVKRTRNSVSHVESVGPKWLSIVLSGFVSIKFLSISRQLLLVIADKFSGNFQFLK